MTRLEVEKLIAELGFTLTAESYHAIAAILFAVAAAIVENTEKDLCEWVSFYVMKKIEQYEEVI